MTSLDEDTEDRMHNWPGDEKILELSKLPTYLVPVGVRGSKHYEYQWRVSFVLHENFLVKSLNDTQMKVFILLRKIAKNYLKPVCDDFTSYMMKNVAFWYFEQHYLEEFVQFARQTGWLSGVAANISRETKTAKLHAARDRLVQLKTLL